MKPEEREALGAWVKKYEDFLFAWFCFAAVMGLISGGVYDANTDNDPFWTVFMFAWPTFLPWVALGANSAVYRLRTRNERKLLTAAKRRQELAELEKELLDD